jgi:hypothetical protein
MYLGMAGGLENTALEAFAQVCVVETSQFCRMLYLCELNWNHMM